MGKKCTPFCAPTCTVEHDNLLVKLLSVQEGNPVTLDAFEEEAEKEFKAGFQPEDPIDDQSPEYRYPLLHWAVVLGKFSVVQFLVKEGHNPCIQSREKSETPLHRAVHCLVLGLKNFSDSHRFKRFKQILDLLAPSVGVQDDNGDTPLHLCAKYITEYYLQNYLNYYKEAMDSMIELVVRCDMKDAFDKQNKDGNTLLHIFAQTHNELCFLFAKKLIKLGAALNIKNNMGHFATEVARRCSYKLFKYIDNRKHKLKKRNFRKLSRGSTASEGENADIDSAPIASKKPKTSPESSTPTPALVGKPQLVPTLTRVPVQQPNECIAGPSTSRPSWVENTDSEQQDTKDKLKFPHTPPHMPGDLEQEDDDQTELKYELVGDLFNELSNCSAGTLNNSALQSKGGVLKDLLRRSGQIMTWINETRKIVSEKSKELEDHHAIHQNIVKSQDDNKEKQVQLTQLMEQKRQELLELEGQLTNTKKEEELLEKEKKQQEEGITKSEQLISTLGQIVAILEND